jgi:lysophospholipase L1-like esterase
MAYATQTWNDGPTGNTPITAVRLGAIETGIGDAHNLGRIGNRIAFLGDSITQGGSVQADNYYQLEWPSASVVVSGSRIQIAGNYGISGDTTAMMLARLPAVLASSPVPGAVSILGGTNDGDAIAQTLPNLTAMIGLCRAAGVPVILCTIPPRTDASQTAMNTRIAGVNRVVKKLADAYRCPVVDFHAALTDPATGLYFSGWSGDGTHPTGTWDAIIAMANAYSAAISPLAPPVSSLSVDYYNDPTNIIPDGLNLAAPNGDGTPANFYQYAGTGFTHSVITDAAFLGKAARVVRTTTDQHVMAQDISASGNFAVGDTIEFAIKVRSTGSTAGSSTPLEWNVALKFTNSTASPSNALYVTQRGNFPAGIVYSGPVVVPVGTTAVQVQVFTDLGAGTLDVGQFTMRNLTTMGLA